MPDVFLDRPLVFRRGLQRWRLIQWDVRPPFPVSVRFPFRKEQQLPAAAVDQYVVAVEPFATDDDIVGRINNNQPFVAEGAVLDREMGLYRSVDRFDALAVVSADLAWDKVTVLPGA